MLDPSRCRSGSCGSRPRPSSFWPLHAERAVVGGHHLQVVRAQRLPHVVLVALLAGAQWRGAGPTWRPRTSPTPDRRRRAGPRARGRGTAGRSRRTRSAPLSRAHASCCDGLLSPRRARRTAGLPVTLASMIARCVASSSNCQARACRGSTGRSCPRPRACSREDIDRRTVLGVHHREQPEGLARLLHGPDDLAVVGVEHARVGHEHLVARDALVGQLLHRLQRLPRPRRRRSGGSRSRSRCCRRPSRARRPAHLSRRWPVVCTAKSITLVVPPQAAAVVPGSKVSDAAVPPNGSSKWVCASMPPGITYLPVASITRVPPRGPRPRSCEPGCEDRDHDLAVDQHIREHLPVAEMTVPPLIRGEWSSWGHRPRVAVGRGGRGRTASRRASPAPCRAPGRG